VVDVEGDVLDGLDLADRRSPRPNRTRALLNVGTRSNVVR